MEMHKILDRKIATILCIPSVPNFFLRAVLTC